MNMQNSAYKSMVLAKQGKTKKKDGNLRRWILEQWVNLSPFAAGLINNIKNSPKCGDSSKNKKGDKSICRPLKKVSQKTPKIASEYTKKQIQKALSIKNKGGRIAWSQL